MLSIGLFLVGGSVLVGGAILAAMVAAALWRSFPGQPPSPSRHGALQGFRGLLALGVFLHHAFIWNLYVHGRGWSDHTVFHQFGESRVVLFFMLTSTLFYGKLIDGRGRDFDWLRLYASRLLRLGPAYWLAMFLMFAVLAVATNFHIDQAGTGIAFRSWTDILASCAVWLSFSMLGTPPIDAYFNTPLVTAGVTWTLPYECTFYLLLPVLALPLRVGMQAVTLALGLAAAVWLATWSPPAMICVSFMGGMAVALIVRQPRIAALLRHRACAVAAMVAMTSAILLFPTMFAPLPMLLLGFSMAVVAADNDLFGILRWRAPQALGNWAYSLYMLHGIALYTLFLLVIGADRAAQLSNLQYAAVIAAFTPVVLGLAWASHRWIESPPMRAVPAVVAALRRLADWRRGPRRQPVASSQPGVS